MALSESRRETDLGRAGRELASATERVRAPAVAAAIVALAGAFTLWTRLIPLHNSLWNDEVHSVVTYINRAPLGVWRGYTPNDHPLFELLTWATSRLISSSTEEVLRLWGVLPALAAGVLFTWWCWRRLDHWVAALFAILAATAPLYMTLSIEARGYGLAFLASAMILIGADLLGRAPSRNAVALFAGGGLLGTWTLPTFALPFVITGALLCLRPGLRRVAITSVAGVGIASAIFYAPVLGALFSSHTEALAAEQEGFGSTGQLAWHGFLSGPLRDLLAPSVRLLAPGLPLRVAEVVGGCFLLAGAAALIRRRERLLALTLLVPAPATYFVFEVTRRVVRDRYLSFVMLPLLVLCAIGLAAAGRALAARSRRLAVAAVIASALLSLYALRRGDHEFTANQSVPVENWRGAVQIAASEPRIVTDDSYGFIDVSYYVLDEGLHIHLPLLSASELQGELCSGAALAYIQHSFSTTPPTATGCLASRGAASYDVKQLNGSVRVWLLPAR